MTALERFLRYTSYYTTSDDDSQSTPSSQRQLIFGNALMDEMKILGLSDVAMDRNGNVYGTLPANENVTAPCIALIAHMDTSPDASGENVKARVVEYREGLRLESGLEMNEELCPGISQYIGKKIVVSDGTTLLGADDKAGIAEIMGAVSELSSVPHGKVKVVITTDEEIGKGADGINVKLLGCDYGYTVDGGAIGEIEYENFNGASATLIVNGVEVHPGSAKGIMKNASAIAAEFHKLLPAAQTPEKTSGYGGFFHLIGMEGTVTSAIMHYIIRDHDMLKFKAKKELFEKKAAIINERYGAGTAETEIVDTYYNMKEKILPHMHLITRAEDAFAANGIKAKTVPVRGGTDGAMLSWQGLPCPNLPAGGYNFHSVREWIPVESLDIMVRVLVTLITGFVK